MKFNIIFITTFFYVAVFSGCSKDDDKDKDKPKAGFKVQLKNSAVSLTQSTTSLTAKLGGVDLIADCAGNSPPGNCIELGLNPDPDIWVNAGCNDDIAQCTTSNTEFFELINPTVANAVLNSQGRSIDIGTFTKVRIYFLNNDGGDAIQCNGVASPAKPAIPINIELPTPIIVAEGETVTVTLNYDPSTVDCSNETTITSAFSSITATVTKN
jgi:hypothetical protein